MSLSRRSMMYGLMGLAGMTRSVNALHAHHHGPLSRDATQAFIAPPGAVDDKAPGVTGQGKLKFKLLYAADHLPPEAQKVLVKAHGGFAVDRRKGKEETYFALPGAGILRISSDFKTIDLLDTTEEMRSVNLHDTNIWYANDGTPYLVLPANGEGRIYTSTLDGKMVHRLNAPTTAVGFKSQEVQQYFENPKNNFAPTAVEFLDGKYYVADGYCKLDTILTALIRTGEKFDVWWNSDLAFGGRGDAIGKFGTGHGITKPPWTARLDVADRPHNRFERFTPEGQYLSLMETPKGSLPCDINYLDHKYSVVPALEGPDKTKGAPIYVLEGENIVSTVMIKEDLGLPNFTHVHNAAVRKIGHKFYIMALAWNPGDFAILEQV